MLTSDLRNKIDRVWEQFWTGGLFSPSTVIENVNELALAKKNLL